MLNTNPELKPTTLLLYLQEKYPEEYNQSHLRTLQRRVKQWKATCGPPEKLCFPKFIDQGKWDSQISPIFKRRQLPLREKSRRARCVNYRHVIDSLRKKPGAFLQYRWRDELLPNDNYRRLWSQLQQQFSPTEASRLMVESLYLAAKLDKETIIAQWLSSQLQ
ncbi:hypothetical protein IQ238_27650 [Pleurocapsales cyanobacterium LEGE 06147]|nr:hypothetical protein [Pleurocapsales cyanobacterium LEGE 06147]